MCWGGQREFPGPGVTARWMCVLSGGVWSFSYFFQCTAFLTALVLVSSSTSSCHPTPTPSNSSWTEDTRSCIFSDTALHLGKDGQKPLAAELDMQIELKFEEFDELVATGRNILDKEHHLTQMVSRVTCSWLSAILNLVSFIDLFVCLIVTEHVNEHQDKKT